MTGAHPLRGIGPGLGRLNDAPLPPGTTAALRPWGRDRLLQDDAPLPPGITVALHLLCKDRLLQDETGEGPPLRTPACKAPHRRPGISIATAMVTLATSGVQALSAALVLIEGIVMARMAGGAIVWTIETGTEKWSEVDAAQKERTGPDARALRGSARKGPGVAPI